MQNLKTDFLVIGSGLAGLAFALKISPLGQVTIISKESSQSANTAWAQGGISAVMSDEDSFESHINDTLVAGAGLCRRPVVENFVKQAPDRIRDLINWQVQFDVHKEEATGLTRIDLTREGGHSFRRILHVEDHTGLEIHKTLLQRVKEDKNIQILEYHHAVDLIINKQINPYDMKPSHCVGAYLLDTQKDEMKSITAKATILATGGAGKVYLYTSNWSGATGDGIAMAYRAGCRIANLEFMQFHPTCLYHPQARNFLITEALRGEGGELVDSRGGAFMKKYHPMGSLAPRDIVARSIDAEIKKSGTECVFLDITKRPREYLQNRFPVIFNQCLKLGIDMSQEPIPVVPAAHYLCGGVVTDENGTTDLPGLFALGETACTGLHGANRLASNSLLECLAMAHNCSELMKKNIQDYPMTSLTPKPWVSPQQSNADEMIVINHMWDEIRRLMWNYVGIVRTNKRLERAQHRMKNILSEVKEYYSHFKMHKDIIELRNIATVADLSIECALRRKESVGIHYNTDCPTNSDATTLKDTIVVRGLN